MDEQTLEIIAGGGTAVLLAAILFKTLSIIEGRASGRKHDDMLQVMTKLNGSMSVIADSLKEIKKVLYEIRAEQQREEAVEHDRLLRKGIQRA